MKLFLLLLVTLAFGRSNVMNKLLDLLEEELAGDDECVDIHDSCAPVVANCQEKGWKTYMEENCQKTCGYCTTEVEVAEMSAQGTAAQCFYPVSEYTTEKYRLGLEKEVYKPNYKAKLNELGVESCNDFVESDCGQRLVSCLKRKACTKRDRTSRKYKCLEWKILTTIKYCENDGKCENSEEELAFNRGKTASDCEPGCLEHEGWRATACLPEFLTPIHPECYEAHEVNQAVSCATVCAAAWPEESIWPEESNNVGTCSAKPGIFRDFYEKNCRKKKHNACLDHSKCTWQPE